MVNPKLLLLGPPEVVISDQTTSISLRKALALVAYLAVEDRAFTREHLATLLWPDLGQERALANLRRTLTLVRETFRNQCIVTDGNLVRLDQETMQVDVSSFRSLAGSHPPDADLDRLEAACELYRSSFLEGFNLGDCEEFDEWQRVIRQRLEADFDAVLEAVVTRYLQMGRPREALSHARRWLELDSLNETAHRALMEIRARTGRADLARRQYHSCTEILAQEGLTPDERTQRLYDDIVANRLSPQAGPAETEAGEATSVSATPAAGEHSRRPRRWLVIAVALAAAVVAGFVHQSGLLTRPDFKPIDIGVLQSDGEFAGASIVLANSARGQRKAGYAVSFSGNTVIGASHGFIVYAADVRIGWHRDVDVFIDEDAIREYVDTHGVAIPPGEYSLHVNVYSRTGRGEVSETDNSLGSSERFSFVGATGIETVTADISYAGEDRLDAANPLKVYMGSLSVSAADVPAFQDHFTVTEDGRHVFPLDSLDPDAANGSGYTMLVVHDLNNDLINPLRLGPGDVAALYKGESRGFVYGALRIDSGAPVYPGELLIIEFARPFPPEPDPWEPLDDEPTLAPLLQYADLPVSRAHTFHNDGEMDEDWARVFLPAGELLVIETSSAGGPWEVWTSIDVADARMNYIGGSDRKPDSEGFYSLLTYTNDTGVDQIFHFLVKPYNEYSFGTDGSGEYVVEYRRGT